MTLKDNQRVTNWLKKKGRKHVPKKPLIRFRNLKQRREWEAKKAAEMPKVRTSGISVVEGVVEPLPKFVFL